MFSHSEFGFVLDSADLDKARLFSIDGSERAVVMVWVESRDDKRFWKACLPKLENVQFDLKIADEHSATDGKVASGCKRLLALRDIGDFVLGPNLIFCLDGDEGFLKQLAISARASDCPYIYYTNIYSIENAFLHHDLLDRVFESVAACSMSDVDCRPSLFLLALSSAIYSSVLLLGFCSAFLEVREIEDYRTEFYSALSAVGAYDLGCDVTLDNIISALRGRLSYVNSGLLQMIYDQGLELEFLHFQNTARDKSVDEETCYLFVRGHDLFNMFVRVIDAASKRVRHAEVKRVSVAYSGGGNIIRDMVAAVHNEWQSYSVALRYGFYAAVPDVPFFNITLSELEAAYAHA